MRRVEVFQKITARYQEEGNGLEQKSSPKRGVHKSESIFARLTGPDTDHAFDFGDKDFPVADLPGFGCIGDGINDGLDFIIGDDHFDFDFRQEIDGILGTTIKFGMPFLPAVTFDLRYRQSFDIFFRQFLFYIFKFEGFDDGFYFFHIFTLK